MDSGKLLMREAEYTDNVIIPLLKHMGYAEVTNNHGIEEFGKDVVFSDFDRFGNKRYYAAQIKVGNISSRNSKQMSDIAEHIEKAFNVDFEDMITKSHVVITEFFIIVSGEFRGGAKKGLLKWQKLQPYIHRIHFYEGHHIEDFRQSNYQDIKELYMAQLNELRRNITLAQEVIVLKPDHFFTGKFLSHNLSILIDKLSTLGNQEALRGELEEYHNTIVSFNFFVKSQMLVKILGDIDEYRKASVYIASSISELSKNIYRDVSNALKKMENEPLPGIGPDCTANRG